jgi:hypothetical protein
MNALAGCMVGKKGLIRLNGQGRKSLIAVSLDTPV